MFIRFVIGEIDPRSGRRRGVFHAGNVLVNSADVTAHDVQRLQDAFDWFNAHLPHPSRFSLSAKPNRKAQSLSWFRATAVEYIARMRDYTQVLDENGLQIEVLKTRRPGFIVYHDEFQVVAYPFADTPT